MFMITTKRLDCLNHCVISASAGGELRSPPSHRVELQGVLPMAPRVAETIIQYEYETMKQCNLYEIQHPN